MPTSASSGEPQHAMQLRMLGNSWVYVTCKCLEAKRTPWKGGTTNTARIKKRAPSWRSLGDFPVGTDSRELVAAYERHLSD